MRRSRVLSYVAAIAVALAAMPAGTAPVAASVPADRVLATGLPDAGLTPGATNPAVRPSTLKQTICKSGWTATVRPSSSYTTGLKRTQIVTYGFTDPSLSSYEEDHLIPLELGGNPTSAKNLWPEPYHVRLADGRDVGARTKDKFENYLKREVCAGHLSLGTAQKRIAVNWVKYWGLAFGVATPTPGSTASPAPIPTPTPSPTASDPYAAARAAGATAIRNDGTWSFSQHRSGTCSHHGGVAVWL